MAGRSRLFSNALNAVTAEVLVLKDGLQLAEVLGCIPVVVESDCLEIVTAFNDNNELWSPYAAILADYLYQAQSITRVTVRHCSREANEVAHSLAKHCYSNNLCCNWDDDPPSFLLDRLGSFDVMAASFLRTIFLTRVPTGTGGFLMRRLANLIYMVFSKKKELCER
jgi:hypothetical protein